MFKTKCVQSLCPSLLLKYILNNIVSTLILQINNNIGSFIRRKGVIIYICATAQSCQTLIGEPTVNVKRFPAHMHIPFPLQVYIIIIYNRQISLVSSLLDYPWTNEDLIGVSYLTAAQSPPCLLCEHENTTLQLSPAVSRKIYK